MSEIKQTATLKLLLPVTVGGVTYSELTFRRMKVKDTLVAENEKDETKSGIMLFARLADVPVAVMEELDMEDFVEVGATVAPLMGKRAAVMLEKLGGANLSPGAT